MTVEPHKPRWNRDTKRLVAWSALGSLVLVVYISRSALPLLVIAAVLAYILQPVVAWLETFRIPRGLGALISIVLLLLIASLAPLLLIPAIIKQLAAIQVDIPGLWNSFLAWGQNLLNQHPRIEWLGYQIDLSALSAQANQYFFTALGDIQVPGINQIIDSVVRAVRTATGLLGTATGLATGVVTALFTSSAALLIMVMYTYYMTKDGARLRSWMAKFMPEPYWPEVNQLSERISRTWAAFFRGQITLSLTIAVITTLALSIIGMPGALILGLIAGALEIIPNLGPILAMFPAVILALIQGSLTLNMSHWLFALLTVGVYFIIQQLENALLVPRIMGQSLNLHPLLILFGIVVGASTVGVIGAFLAAPVLATVRLIVLYAHAKMIDSDPFPVLLELEQRPKPGSISKLAKRVAGGRAVQKIKERLKSDLPNEDPANP